MLKFLLVVLTLSICAVVLAIVGELSYAAYLVGDGRWRGGMGNIFSGLTAGLILTLCILAIGVWALCGLANPFDKEHELELKKHEYDVRSGNFPN